MEGGDIVRKVQKQSRIPIYVQLQEIITEMIDNEELQEHDPIPTEHEFCAYHNVSRMTVRSAIMSLVNEGVLYREQGKGTFISPNKPRYELSGLKGLTEVMSELGHDVQTKVIDFSYVDCTKKIASILDIPQGAQALKIHRLRFVDEEAYALETVWMDPQQFPDLTEETITTTPLYNIFRDVYRLHPAYTKQTVTPVRLNEMEKQYFQLSDEPLGLLFERTTYAKNDRVIEFTKSVYRIDKHQFEMHLEL